MKVIATMDGDSTCGAIVWWTLKGRTNHERLKEALAKEGSTANPPEPPSAMAALSFACGEVARGKGRNLARRMGTSRRRRD